ncbi:hypothetical protein [Cryobacterium sp. MLB-32]|uniref:hypothetical protein n=1 Tax=Cryobacterium sp. MLB-32 TaxID=1529318 RepID=UPI0012E0BFBC|nr:hypothetical protein [Cryobacterium sp. MLB-32]
MPKTLTRVAVRSLEPSPARAVGIISREQRMPRPLRSPERSAAQGTQQARVRTRIRRVVVGILLVIVLLAAVATTFAIAGIDLSGAAPATGVPGLVVAVAPPA